MPGGREGMPGGGEGMPGVGEGMPGGREGMPGEGMAFDLPNSHTPHRKLIFVRPINTLPDNRFTSLQI